MTYSAWQLQYLQDRPVKLQQHRHWSWLQFLPNAPLLSGYRSKTKSLIKTLQTNWYIKTLTLNRIHSVMILGFSQRSNPSPNLRMPPTPPQESKMLLLHLLLLHFQNCKGKSACTSQAWTRKNNLPLGLVAGFLRHWRCAAGNPAACRVAHLLYARELHANKPSSSSS